MLKSVLQIMTTARISLRIIPQMVTAKRRKAEPINKVNTTKMSKNAPPPLIPVTYGNFQIAPSPLAAPADDKINPSFNDH